jgi:hypothetical protein
VRRPRATLGALAAAGAVAVLAVAVARNPGGYVVLDRLARPVPWGVAFWACVALAAWLYRPRRIVAWLGVAAVAVLAACSLFFAWLLSDPAPVIAHRAVSARYDVRAVEVRRGIDVTYEVRVRDRRGLLSRERTAWTGPPVRALRLTGQDAAEVTDEAGRTYPLRLDR